MQTVPTKRIGLTKWSTWDLNPKLQLGSSILQQLCQLFHVQHHRIKIYKYSGHYPTWVVLAVQAFN